jgi:hemerythrin-like domain-containing protein
VSAEVTTQRPWTQEMVIVHRAVRREFRLLAENIPHVAAGDTRRASRMAAHADFMLDILHHHHTGEDELLWPLLRQRCAPDVDLIDRMETQHLALVAVVDQIVPALAAWRAAPATESAAVLAGLFAQLNTGLAEHMDDEEANILPLCEQYLSVAEWGQLAARAQQTIEPDRMLFVLGLLMEEATEDEQERWLAGMPEKVAEVFDIVGRGQYAQEVATLR